MTRSGSHYTFYVELVTKEDPDRRELTEICHQRKGGENHLSNYPKNWPEIAQAIKHEAGWKCQRCGHPHDPAAGYVLTVHHIDSNKANVDPHNLVALCQRCHMHHVGRLRRYGPEDQRQMRLWTTEPQEPPTAEKPAPA